MTARKNVVPLALVMCVILRKEAAQSVASVVGGIHSVMRPVVNSVSRINVPGMDNATLTLAV